MPFFVALLSVFLTTSPALAKGGAKAPNGVPWQVVDRRAESVYEVGWYTSIGSLALTLYGSLRNQVGVYLAGESLQVGGIGTMAGASLRQRRSIVERGGKVPGGYGMASWAALGGSLALSGATLAVPQVEEDGQTFTAAWAGLYVGSLATGIAASLLASVQHRKNASGRRTMRRRSSVEPSRPAVQWNVHPVVGKSMTGGFVQAQF